MGTLLNKQELKEYATNKWQVFSSELCNLIVWPLSFSSCLMILSLLSIKEEIVKLQFSFIVYFIYEMVFEDRRSHSQRDRMDKRKRHKKRKYSDLSDSDSSDERETYKVSV